jgi:outer membrane protein insertion porin family
MYYKGGETVRGFNRAGFGPRDLATGDALGGKTYYAATAEVRYPFPFLPDDLGIKGAVFVDVGSVFGVSDWVKQASTQCTVVAAAGQPPNICLADDNSPRVSIGTSLMWDSPMGPLRADFGWAVIKEEYDKDQLFRFGASTKF